MKAEELPGPDFARFLADRAAEDAATHSECTSCIGGIPGILAPFGNDEHHLFVQRCDECLCAGRLNRDADDEAQAQRLARIIGWHAHRRYDDDTLRRWRPFIAPPDAWDDRDFVAVGADEYGWNPAEEHELIVTEGTGPLVREVLPGSIIIIRSDLGPAEDYEAFFDDLIAELYRRIGHDQFLVVHTPPGSDFDVRPATELAATLAGLDLLEPPVRFRPRSYPFDPDWTIHPGAFLAEWMDDHGLTDKPSVVAVACGRLDPAVITGILDGSRELDEPTAIALATGTGIPASFWLRLEAMFRAGLAAGKTWHRD